MEKIISQTVEFAEISIYKNYSNISDREHYLENKLEYKLLGGRHINSKFAYLDIYPKNKYNYFYSNNCNKSFVDSSKPHHPIVSYETINIKKPKVNFFTTINPRHIKRYYANPFASIKITNFHRSVKKEGNKIIIKRYKQLKERTINKRYFTRVIDSVTITFNLATGNFNILEYNKVGRKITKHFSTNSFITLKQALIVVFEISKLIPSDIALKFSSIYENFNNVIFNNIILNTFNFTESLIIRDSLSFHIYKDSPANFWNDVKNLDRYILVDFLSLWLHKFIEIKKIKAPDDSSDLIIYFYPTEYFLKKNNRKLIASILDRFHIKSKLTIKLLHQNQNIDLYLLVGLCHLFGNNFSKYVGNLLPSIFSYKINYNDRVNINFRLRRILGFIELDGKVDFTDNEKNNLVKIINDFGSKSVLYDGQFNQLIDTIYDHYKMLVEIRHFFPNLHIQSRSYNSFNKEHTELSLIHNKINRGTFIEYVFDNEMINKIEEPIEIDNKTFIPKILKTTDEYYEEGKYMHHCVGSYIDKDRSIIISLRYKDERITCEYDSKSRSCIQARYFTNNTPPDHYIKPLNILNKRVIKFSGKFTSIKKIKKILNKDELIKTFNLNHI